MKHLRLLSILIGFILSLYNLRLSAQDYTVYPIPQKMTAGTQQVTLSRNINVVAATGIDETLLQRMQEVLEDAGHTYSLGETLKDDETNLLLGTAGTGDAADAYATTYQIPRQVFEKSENRFDSHVLQLNANHSRGDILVLGNEDGSAYYAFATLEQLLEQASENTLRTVTFEDFAYVKTRGIVEGFYGHVYSVENRLDLFDYCKRYKMNTYFYGPKSDPYHTGLWRDEYPETITDMQRSMGQITQDDLRTLAAEAKKCHVDFVWSIHPALQGGGIDFYNLDPGVEQIMVKFQHLYDLGVRHFGVSIDDMVGHPQTQHELADKVQRKLLEKYNTAGNATDAQVGPLLFVPTQYALNYGTHTLGAFSSIHKDVELVFTGYDCFSNIRAYAFNMMNDIVGRKPIMWWNNPVNDDHDDYLYLHGLTARWIIEDRAPIPTMAGLIMNPMNQPQASKICLFGAADYAWNPAKFDEESSWKASLQSILHEPELHEALLEFIRVMSSYAQTGESEEYGPLYTDFEQHYDKEQIPDATELLAAMHRAHDACTLLQTLKDHEVRSYQLLYADIAPWLNKIQAQTDLVCQSIELMQGETDLSDWTRVSQLLESIDRLHKDPKYFLSVLEGSGTETYETQREAQPTPQNMNAFLDFLSEKLADFVPTLPERNREVEVITNQAHTTARINQENGLALAGLQGLVLGQDDYVGLNLKAIKSVIVGALPGSLPQTVKTEWSVNGKEWTAFTPDGVTGQELVYVRLKNTGTQPYSFTFDQLLIGMETGGDPKALSVRTNMNPYQYYVIEHVIDDNLQTKFWSNRDQQPGDFVEVDYGKDMTFNRIDIHFAPNDQITGKTAIQVSGDGQHWETISHFTSEDLRDDTYTCSAQGHKGRFIRLYLEEVTQRMWFQLIEIKARGAGITPVVTDHQGTGISLLDDSQLTAGYQAQTAGHIIYRFIENLWIDDVQIYHNTSFNPAAGLPVISVKNDEKWTKVGELNEPCTIVSLKKFAKPSQLKIEWNDENIPMLYEIYVTGEPYQEGMSTGIASSQQEQGLTWTLEDRTWSVHVPRLLDKMVLIDAQGKIRAVHRPADYVYTLKFPESGFWLVQLKYRDQSQEVIKLMVK